MSSRLALVLLAFLTATVSLSPVRITAWGYANGQIYPAGFSSDVEMISPINTADLDRDGTEEKLHLERGRAAILKAGEVAWQSPAAWQVEQAAIADLTHSGQPQVVLLIWREFAPWPIDRYIPHPGRIQGFQNSAGQSCHLILIGWKSGMYREVWAGSALAEPIKAFAVIPDKAQNHRLLVTLDGLYSDLPEAPAQAFSIWEWNGFGFSLITRQKGKFDQLQIGLTGAESAIFLTGE